MLIDKTEKNKQGTTKVLLKELFKASEGLQKEETRTSALMYNIKDYEDIKRELERAVKQESYRELRGIIDAVCLFCDEKLCCVCITGNHFTRKEDK